MSLELSASDKAEIGRIVASFGSRIVFQCDEAIYTAGMRAGIERVRKLCEQWPDQCEANCRSLLDAP